MTVLRNGAATRQGRMNTASEDAGNRGYAKTAHALLTSNCALQFNVSKPYAATAMPARAVSTSACTSRIRPT